MEKGSAFGKAPNHMICSHLLVVSAAQEGDTRAWGWKFAVMDTMLQSVLTARVRHMNGSVSLTLMFNCSSYNDACKSNHEELSIVMKLLMTSIIICRRPLIPLALAYV